ncbi:MAGUK p55 subfamily member 2 [Mizuhopecten yessoensis]|uniref:MAGUK p55 subfamily member 2 n=1 Tax=Mizuhopecten yessoensis TaxID=6573 RepID=A0A210PIW9_MIZYE|nr:MAGUK p55 subfamily member 2 [Mizuhopecten yessoensis]
MPAATDGAGLASLHNLQDQLAEIGDEVDADQSDLAFLKQFLEGPLLESLVQAKDRLEQDPVDQPSDESASRMVADCINDIASLGSNSHAVELEKVLSAPHFMAMMSAYDDIADKNYEEEVNDVKQLSAPPPPMVFNNVADQVRLVGIRKDKSAPLGITVKIDEHSDLVIARIMSGSMIDKQGLLHVGDIIKEVNGLQVFSPEQLMEIIRFTEGSITLKIVPTVVESQIKSQKYMRAHFNYDPKKDRLIPCADAGLTFSDGDVLQILSSEDPNWWQARVVTKDEDGQTGLIPSQPLEEKRKAFVQPDYDYSKSSLLCGLKRRKKKKIKYATKNTTDFDRCDLSIYEEVARMPPFERKTLIIVGATGVGRRSLKERLLKDDPRRFGAVMPHTCREMRDGEVNGKGYFFTDRETMEDDIKAGLYLEYGEYNGNLYGTKIDSINHVTNAGKMCVLDVNPTSLKILKTAEFMPFVVFIAAPSAEALKRMYDYGRQKGIVVRRGDDDYRKAVEESAQIERVYKGLFDMTIVNDSFEDAYKQLRMALNDLGTESQWVPINWGPSGLLVPGSYWSYWSTGPTGLLVLLVYWSHWSTGPTGPTGLLILLVLLVYWSTGPTGPTGLLVLLVYWSYWSHWSTGPTGPVFTLVYWSHWSHWSTGPTGLLVLLVPLVY